MIPSILKAVDDRLADGFVYAAEAREGEVKVAE
jgi:hypothetical protein